MMHLELLWGGGATDPWVDLVIASWWGLGGEAQHTQVMKTHGIEDRASA